MLLCREKYVYLDSFKTTCTHITTANTKKMFQIGQFFTVPICVKKLFKILRNHFEKTVGP